MTTEQTADRFAITPDRPSGVGVLVLSGSSGRIEEARCRLLAEHGATAVSPRWFGGAGQPPGICEVPLETFTAELDRLAQTCGRLAVLGVSKGAEAALLLGVRDPRVSAVIGFAPTPVVWANVGPGRDGADRPCRSSWTWAGVPLSFVPYDDEVEPVGDPPEFVEVYRRSLQTNADSVAAARIPSEQIGGAVVLVAGGDDRMWPSVPFANAVVRDRRLAGLETTLVSQPEAGHRCVLPGEQAPPASTVAAHGGTPVADADLGRLAWPEIVRVLGLGRPPVR